MSGLLREIMELSHKIQIKTSPIVTETDKEEALIRLTIEKVVINLLEEKISISTIFQMLFYHWIELESDRSRLPTNLLRDHPESYLEIAGFIVSAVMSRILSLPDIVLSDDMIKLTNLVNEAKATMDNDFFEDPLEENEYRRQQKIAHNTLYEMIYNLGEKVSDHGLIVDSLLRYFLRLFTMPSQISEQCYQKIDYYFSDVVTEVRNYLPKLHRRVKQEGHLFLGSPNYMLLQPKNYDGGR